MFPMVFRPDSMELKALLCLVSSRSREVPGLDELTGRIADDVPATPRASIVHGDFRLDNAIFHPSEPRILAVLDWELSTIGDSLADMATFRVK